jgi:hypothetical protein
MNFMPTFFAQGTEPAGGAALGEILIATFGAGIVTLALLVFGFGHRTGRIGTLEKLGRFSERMSGLPAWAALPSFVATLSLLTAVFGMYWDIALHIGVGRDEGPLANPAHYFILAGLFGIFSAGFLAMVLPKEKPSETAVKLGRDWYAPLGGVLICACGAFALIGFPLDDMWHRIFGQDVTLWGPTHLMLIGGASMTLVGIAVLMVEARRAKRAAGKHVAGWSLVVNGIAGTGGFMLGLSTFQAEFDFGVPQFRFVFAPILVSLAAGIGLVVARIYGGRGVALGAVAFFLVVRGVLALFIGPVFGQTTPHMPLYVVSALVVEGVALVVSTDRRLAYGLWCGLGIGTIGLASEWAWSHVWMPIAWSDELLPEGVLLGFPAAMAGALIGAWIGDRSAIEPRPGRRDLRIAALAGAAVVAAIVPYALQKPVQEGVVAQVTTADVRSGDERTVQATVRIDPPSAADGAEFVNVTAWQGDGLVVDALEPTGRPGEFRTTQPIPVHGNWKALVRLSRGDTLSSIPIFLPSDVALKAKEVPAAPRFERAFVAEYKILQREQKDAPTGLPLLGYSIVAAIALALLVLLAWGLHRLACANGSGRLERKSWSSRSPRRSQSPSRPSASSVS